MLRAVRAAVLAKAEHLQQLRRLVPARRVPAVVTRRLNRVWEIPEFRRESELQMQFLLEHTDRASEAPALARGYAEWMMLRSFLRFHPKAITRQPVRGIEWLMTRRDPDRAVVLHLMHHAHYNGMFASLARLGPKLDIIMSPTIMGTHSVVQMKQQRHVICMGGTAHPSTIGTDAIVSLLQPGAILTMASDLPGRTPMTFLGQDVLGSFGAVRIAAMTNTPVVLVTTRRDASGTSYFQVEEPLEPSDFADPRDLLDEILRIHGEAVLAWPEALDVPTARWNHVGADD